MMKLAMPDADISVTTVGQIAVLNGTVEVAGRQRAGPAPGARLLNPGVNVSDPARSSRSACSTGSRPRRRCR
jgi:pilus assembly protein CpaC